MVATTTITATIMTRVNATPPAPRVFTPNNSGLSPVSDAALTRIPEQAYFDELQRLAAAYRERHGRAPIPVSHWDPSPEAMAALKSSLPLVHYGNPVPYQYSYYLDRRKEVTVKLGLPASSIESLITENGSISISAAANWLSSMQVKNILLLRPAYFTTRYALQRLGLMVREAIEVR